jgi:phosphatidylserine decarboxylase precursor-related protein
MRLQAFWEARWILAFLALLAIVSGLFSAWAFWFFVLLFLYTLAFFRDPDRAAPVDPNVIVAAADGTIMDILELDENEVLKNKTRRVGIFLSVFDVHTNRAPIDGRVVYRQHRRGFSRRTSGRIVPRRMNHDVGIREPARHMLCDRSRAHRKTHRGVGERGGRN